MEDALWHQLQNSHLHDDDDDRRNSETETDNNTDDDEGKELETEEADEQTSHSQLNNRISGPQTGPKGVIADHAYYKQQQLADNWKARADYNARMLAKAPVTTTYLDDLRQQQQDELILESKASRPRKSITTEDNTDDDIDDEDDAFLQSYRQKRFLEFQKLQNKNHALRQQRKLFGQVRTITAEDYADEIDNEWRSVPVIIHLFDSTLPRCRELDAMLDELSRKYRLAKFLRVSASELDFDLVGSPAILAYQGGLLVANLVRIVDLCRGNSSATTPSRFDIGSIEEVLLRHGALSEHDLYERPAHTAREDDDD